VGLLQNKNCCITGATGGLGGCIARELASQNCNLFLTGRDCDKLINLYDELSKNRGIQVFYASADLSNDAERQMVVESVREGFEFTNILINCAGLFPVKNIEESSEKDFDECFDINVKVPFILCKEFSKDMKKGKWGRIVNIGSSSSYGGFKKTSLYCSSKHALLGLSRSLHDELKEFNIKTYCVSPGSIQTEMGRDVVGQDFNTFIRPKEIAEYIVFVISQDGNMISEEIRLNRMIIR